MNKKKLISFFMLLMILMSMGLTQNAYAASNWKLTSDGWRYYEDGTMKTDWVLTDGKWYYINNLGIMQTGWINDNGTWYYLCDTGVMDNSKTTTIMPAEIKTIYDIIKNYSNSEILKYSCIYHVSNNGYLSEWGFAGESLYKFYSENQYGDKISEYYYDQSNGNVYELNKGNITLLGSINLIDNINKTDDNNNSITCDDAIEKVREYLRIRDIDNPSKIEYKYENINSYAIYCDYIFKDNTRTSGWYYVDKSTGNVTSMF